MKTIGILGGMCWESTITYYEEINLFIQKHIGPSASAKCIVNSVNFAEIEENMVSGNWSNVGAILADAGRMLESAGADFIIIASNTSHKVYDEVRLAVSLPVLHIGDVLAEALKEKGVKKAALLGTAYTMKDTFISSRIEKRGVEILLPEDGDQVRINNIINEYKINSPAAKSKALLLRCISTLKKRGAEGIILGCTELGLMITQKDTDIPIFDSALLHAQASARLALSK